MSGIDALRQQVAKNVRETPLAQEKLAEATGTHKTGNLGAGNINDLLEEAGMMVATLKDKRSLDKEKVRQGAGTDMEAIKRIADYYEKLPDMPKEAALRDLVKTLQKFEDLLEEGGGKDFSSDDILQALQEFDEDVTHQYEALQVVSRYFEENQADFEQSGPSLEKTEARKTLRAQLDAAQTRFDQNPDIMRDVRAGYAIAKEASAKAPDLETDPATLRDHYREMLRSSNQNMAQLFDKMTTFNLRLAFSAVVDLFFDAAGNDLAATTSDTDALFLGGLLKELGNLKTMNTVFHESYEALDRIQRIDPGFANGADAGGPIELTSALLHFCCKPTTNINDAKEIVKPFDNGAPQTMVTLSNEVRELHSKINDQVFPSNHAIVQQKNALQTLQSEYTRLEEQFYESQAAAN